MTPQQKNLIAALVVGNFLLFCCIAPVAYFFYIQPPDADPMQSAYATVQSYMPATPTRRATLTPTRVIPTATLEPGWKLTTVSASKFAIASPPSWDIKTLTPSNMAAQIEEIAKKNPQLAGSLKGQSAEYVAKIKFIGYETTPAVVREGFIPNVNVLHEVAKADMTLDDWIKIAGEELAAYKPTIRKVRGSAGDMAETRFTLPLKLSNTQSVNLASAQYLIVRGRDAYAISCVVVDKQAAAYMPVCEKIGLSFRWAN
jgi:hypothetical protein